MCGVIGCLIRNKSIDLEQMHKAINILNHRGPDEKAIWQSPDKNFALGHARLSIIDLLNGHQPLSSEDNQIWAVVNGEFYDYEIIRSRLIEKGHKFKTLSDSEILVALYLEYGLNLFAHLRGEFSFILIDLHKQQLVAGRDQMGVKPLYYSTHNNNLYIASEIKALLAFDLPSIWDFNTIYNINHNIFPTESTCFANIRILPAGHFLIATPSQLTVNKHKYWDLKFPSREELTTTVNEENYIKQFRAIFEDSVKTRLKADVPIGCYLSGGIDSSAVLAMASKLTTKPIKSFTISFNDELFDESHIARRTANYLGADYTEVEVTDMDIVNNFSDSIWHGESIVSNTHGVALFLLSKLVNKSGYKVVLTGAGSDELLAGYSFFKEDLLADSNISHEKREELLYSIRSNPIGAGLVTTTSSQQKILDENLKELININPTLFKLYSGRGKDFLSLYSEDFLKITKNNHAVKMLIQSLGLSTLSSLDNICASSYIFSKTTLPGYLLSTIGDKLEMAHSIEGRVPFLDQKMVQFNMKLPQSLKFKGITEKYILREAVKDILPKELYVRTKQPFCAPPANKLLLNFMEDIFNSELLKNLPFYNYKAVLSLLHSLPLLQTKERIAADSRLTEILSACLLAARYKINNVV